MKRSEVLNFGAGPVIHTHSVVHSFGKRSVMELAVPGEETRHLISHGDAYQKTSEAEAHAFRAQLHEAAQEQKSHQ